MVSTVSYSHTAISPSVSEPQTFDVTDVLQSNKTPDLAQLDVGTVYAKSESPADFVTAIHSLTVAEKYELLTNHRVPHKES